jgi:sugar O-acyltransferase (sialic acid O-acetyltransferase NeuD family)
LKTRLLIFPYNGNGIEAVDCLRDDFELIGFVDDTPEKQGEQNGYTVFGREAFAQHPDAKVLAVPGSPVSYTKRKQIIDGLGITADRFATIVHPMASVSSRAKLGINTLIMSGVVITSNAIIGDHVCVLPNSVIHHDTVIMDYTLVGSNVTVAGHSVIGKECYIGSGSSIINGITIGNRTLVGMGSNVIRAVADNMKIAGNPAKVI